MTAAGWKWRAHVGCDSPGRCLHRCPPDCDRHEVSSAHFPHGHPPGWLRHWPSFSVALLPLRPSWRGRRRSGPPAAWRALLVLVVGPPYPGRPGAGALIERYEVAGDDGAAVRRRLTEVGDARQAACDALGPLEPEAHDRAWIAANLPPRRVVDSGP